MSFNMNKYKRRMSQANETVNILRNPSISVEPGSALQQQIASLASRNIVDASKSGVKLNTIKDTFFNRKFLLSVILLVVCASVIAGVFWGRKQDKQSYPPPPKIEELPSNNCSAFSRAGNIPDGGLITISGKITVLAHERSFPAILFNDTEMIEVICDPETAMKIKPYSGSYVKLTGKKFACSLLVANGTRPIPIKPTATTKTAGPTTTPDPIVTKGARKLALVYFYFQDDSTKPTDDPQSLTDAIFDPFDGMNALFRNASYGYVNFSGIHSENADVFGYVQIPFKSRSGCNFWDWTFSAMALASVNQTLYDHVMFVGQPKSNVCDFGGVAILYGWWSFVITQYFKIEGAQTHEMGHNLGFNHAGGITCYKGSSTFGDISACSSYEYGDRFETMSSGSRNHINAFHREELGWIPPSSIMEVRNSGNYTINTLNGMNKDIGLLGLKIPLIEQYVLKRKYPDATFKDVMVYYYFELVKGVTYDKPSYGPVKLTNGVYIRLAPAPLISDSETYAYAINKDLVTVGDWFSDPKQNFTISLVSLSEDQATLSVSFGF